MVRGSEIHSLGAPSIAPGHFDPEASVTENAGKLQVDDEDFLVASLIDRCPKIMMLRELVKNAVEAASLTLGGQGNVRIGVVDISGVQKLAIRNTGPGMDAGKLHSMCNLAASFGKTKGLKGNFGMGAKVASLAANSLGVRYHSCAAGRVHEVTIGKYAGLYSRLQRSVPGVSHSVDILDVSAAYPAEARAMDWTEVVLFGRRPGQDTAVDPYDDDPTMPSFWIPAALYHRFYRIPANVEILLQEGIHWHQGVRLFHTMSARSRTAFACAESVLLRNGIAIHYFHDPAHPDRPWENASSDGALQSSASSAALVYHDELYDVRTGSPWAYEAPKFGITFAARHISVLVELPDDFPVVPEAYRQFLRYEDGEQHQVSIEDFADLVRDSRPAWLLELLASFRRARTVEPGLEGELRGLRRHLGVNLYVHIDRPAGSITPAEEARWIEPELDIVQLGDPDDIQDRWLTGRAACYYPNTRQLFVNITYDSIRLLAERVAAMFEPDHSEAVAQYAREAAIQAVIRRVARALLFGLAKEAQPALWHPGHIEKATAPEALSIAADDWLDAVAPTHEAVLRRLSGVAEGVA